MAIFRKYQLFANKYIPFNQVGLYFSENPDSNVLFALGSVIETLFPFVPFEAAKEKLDHKISKSVDINLYVISVAEMTNNRYKCLICENAFSDEKVTEIHAASVMDREDEIRERMIGFTLASLNGQIIGVKQDNGKEKINDPGKVFGLTSFLNYNPASQNEWSLCEKYNYGNPDEHCIREAIIKYKKANSSKYKFELQHLFV